MRACALGRRLRARPAPGTLSRLRRDWRGAVVGVLARAARLTVDVGSTVFGVGPVPGAGVGGDSAVAMATCTPTAGTPGGGNARSGRAVLNTYGLTPTTTAISTEGTTGGTGRGGSGGTSSAGAGTVGGDDGASTAGITIDDADTGAPPLPTASPRREGEVSDRGVVCPVPRPVRRPARASGSICVENDVVVPQNVNVEVDDQGPLDGAVSLPDVSSRFADGGRAPRDGAVVTGLRTRTDTFVLPASAAEEARGWKHSSCRAGIGTDTSRVPGRDRRQRAMLGLLFRSMTTLRFRRVDREDRLPIPGWMEAHFQIDTENLDPDIDLSSDWRNGLSAAGTEVGPASERARLRRPLPGLVVRRRRLSYRCWVRRRCRRAQDADLYVRVRAGRLCRQHGVTGRGVHAAVISASRGRTTSGPLEPWVTVVGSRASTRTRRGCSALFVAVTTSGVLSDRCSR